MSELIVVVRVMYPLIIGKKNVNEVNMITKEKMKTCINIVETPLVEGSMQEGFHRTEETLLAVDNHRMVFFGPCFSS